MWSRQKRLKEWGIIPIQSQMCKKVKLDWSGYSYLQSPPLSQNIGVMAKITTNLIHEPSIRQQDDFTFNRSLKWLLRCLYCLSISEVPIQCINFLSAQTTRLCWEAYAIKFQRHPCITSFLEVPWCMIVPENDICTPTNKANLFQSVTSFYSS